MDRRNILKSVVLGAGLFTASKAATAQSAKADTQPGPYVRTRDGTMLFYKDWGSGKPVVFLHAWALPSDMWDYQMVSMSEQGLRCVAYDRRGHGRSSVPAGGYDYDTLADDLATMLDRLDLKEVTLVGYSMASGEMVRYLTRHGAARIARLAFIAPAATPFLLKTADNPNGIPAEKFEYFRRNMLMRDYPKWLEDNRKPFFTAETSPQVQDWVRGLMLTTSLKAAVECNRSSTSTDFRAELPKIRLPALVIHGDIDASAPLALTGRPTAALIPGAELKVYEGAPHGLFVTHKERLTADLLAFATL
jgi:pimeloyl-ACP methyl ester carboxylesterase